MVCVACLTHDISGLGLNSTGKEVKDKEPDSEFYN